MGVTIHDIIQQQDKILIIFKLTERDENRYGSFLRINFEDLYLYENLFIELVKERFTISEQNDIKFEFRNTPCNTFTKTLENDINLHEIKLPRRIYETKRVRDLPLIFIEN